MPINNYTKQTPPIGERKGQAERKRERKVKKNQLIKIDYQM